jgi:hypothetical protein
VIIKRYQTLLFFLELSLYFFLVVTGHHIFWASFFSWALFKLIIAFWKVEERNFVGQIGPIDFWQFGWYIFLVFLPIAISINRTLFVAPLPSQPNYSTINLSILLLSMCFIASRIGLSFYPKKRASQTFFGFDGISAKFAISFLCFGFLGCFFLVKAVGLHISLISLYGQFLGNSTSWTKFLALTLTPLLFQAIFIKFFDKLPIGRSRIQNLIFVLMIAIALLPLLSFGLNRAVIVIPVVSMILAVSGSNLRPTKVIAIILAFLILAFSIQLVGQLRSIIYVTKGGQLNLNSVGYIKNPTAWNQFQNYLNAPQYMAFALQNIDQREVTNTTPLKSMISPLPKIRHLNSSGKDGSSLYNHAIYGDLAQDQYLSSVIEMWMAWGPLGLLIIGFLQGYIVSFLWRKFFILSSNYAKYLVCYVSVWLAFLPAFSVAVMSQIFFYNLLIPYLIIKIFSIKKMFEGSQ